MKHLLFQLSPYIKTDFSVISLQYREDINKAEGRAMLFNFIPIWKYQDCNKKGDFLPSYFYKWVRIPGAPIVHKPTKKKPKQRKTQVYKWWRTDLNKWEEKHTWKGVFTWYKYSIWKQGKLRVKIRLFKAKPTKAQYIKQAATTKIVIGANELAVKYNNSKWQVPFEYEIDLSSPESYTLTFFTKKTKNK